MLVTADEVYNPFLMLLERKPHSLITDSTLQIHFFRNERHSGVFVHDNRGVN